MGSTDLQIKAKLQADKRTSLPCDIPVRVEDWGVNGTLTAESSMGFTSLEDFISDLKSRNNVPSDEFCRSLILGIILRLKQANKDLDDEEIITEKDIFITGDTDDKSVVIQCQNSNGERTNSLQEHLPKVFCYILTNGETDMDSSKIHYTDTVIGKDFLDTLWVGKFGSWNELIRHPFFWDDASKIEFIKRYFRSIGNADTRKVGSVKHIKGIHLTADYKYDDWKTPGIENELKSANIESKLVKGWITRLFLKDDEESSTSKIAVVKKVLVCYRNPNLDDGNSSHPYNGDTIFDLVRFFRNTHAHFLEMNTNIQECFGGGDGLGYWPFFSRRYPRILMDVYKASKRQRKQNLEPTPPPETKFLYPLKFK